MRTVHLSLHDIFGENFSTRCLQSSLAISAMLEEFGIDSQVFSGAACLSRVSRGNPFEVSWAGFWGEDHHAWVMANRLELIDLTISQLHLHPATEGDDDEEIPALWWHPADIWPPIIKYLPDGVVKTQLPAEDQEQLENLLKRLPVNKAKILEEFNDGDILYSPILYGPESLNVLYEQGHTWLVKSVAIQERNMAMPDWVLNRDRELMQRFEERN